MKWILNGCPCQVPNCGGTLVPIHCCSSNDPAKPVGTIISAERPECDYCGALCPREMVRKWLFLCDMNDL